MRARRRDRSGNIGADGEIGLGREVERDRIADRIGPGRNGHVAGALKGQPDRRGGTDLVGPIPQGNADGVEVEGRRSVGIGQPDAHIAPSGADMDNLPNGLVVQDERSSAAGLGTGVPGRRPHETRRLPASHGRAGREHGARHHRQDYGGVQRGATSSHKRRSRHLRSASLRRPSRPRRPGRLKTAPVDLSHGLPVGRR